MTPPNLKLARAVLVEVALDALLCFLLICIALALRHWSWRSEWPSASDLPEIARGGWHYCVLTFSVRAVMHIPWHFVLRRRLARRVGLDWIRTLGVVAGSYALAYLIGIAATGGVLWETLVERAWLSVLPSFAASLAAPFLTHKLLGETIDTLAAQGRPDPGAER